MRQLADDSLQPAAARLWIRRIVISLLVIALVTGLTLLLKSLVSGSKAPKRQIARMVLLPDTPPPPPPKQEPRPEPQRETLKQAPVEQPKLPETTPQQIKMEGPAGNAPSPFAAGTVTNDYVRGDPGAASAGGTGTTSDRAQERFYANNARQMLRDEIERHLRSETSQLTAVFSIWLAVDGSIRRFDLTPSGSAQGDTELSAALADVSQALKLPPPPAGIQQPLRFRLMVRPLG